MRTLLSGIAAGLVAGVLLGILFTIVVPSAPGLPMAPLMDLLARGLGIDGRLGGWAVVLGAGALLGALFGVALTRRSEDSGVVASAALGYGLLVWAAGSALLVPWLLGLPPVAGLANPLVWPTVVVLLTGVLLFVSVLAAVFLVLTGRRAREAPTEQELRRAA